MKSNKNCDFFFQSFYFLSGVAIVIHRPGRTNPSNATDGNRTKLF